MKHLVMAVFALGLMLTLVPSDAEGQSACEFYRVKKGDSLRDISKLAYGDDKYRRIWRANRAEVGRNPNVLTVGIVLKLPCLDGSMPVGDAPPRIAAPSGDAISFVTANGYLPYTDEGLSRRGLFTQLVETAVMRATPDTEFEVVFVNDWAAHRETLLPRQVFDASFPWPAPSCDGAAPRSPVDAYACEHFIYSDPFYEIVDGFVGRADSDLSLVAEPAGFAGKIICRPEGYPTGHLDQLGLMPPAVTLVQPVSARACFEHLMAGRVDLVSLDTRAAERVARDMQLINEVSENPYVYSIEPLRVALHKDNPKSASIVETLNTGLELMLQSGEWASIVSNGLKTRPAELVN